jgi:hypothetical protein
MAYPRALLGLLAVGLSGSILAACGASSTNGLTNADLTSYLGVQANPAVFTNVAGGAGLDAPLPVGANGECPGWYHKAFVPPGKRGEAAQGEGIPITYPEVMVLAWRCASPADARVYFGQVSRHRVSVNGVGDQAVILNRTDDSGDGYPNSRVYFVGWRERQTIGVLELAGPDTDRRITTGLAETLASRAAASH